MYTLTGQVQITRIHVIVPQVLNATRFTNRPIRIYLNNHENLIYKHALDKILFQFFTYPVEII